MSKCKEVNCDKYAAFNVLGKKPFYCKKHIKTGMIDLVHKLCVFEECNKRASLNFLGKKPLYCKKHSESGMVCVLNKRCNFEECDKNPIFNLPNEKGGIYCKIHAEKGMINVKSKRCIFKDCDKHPNFNLPNEKGGIYCKIHAEKRMINVRSKRCIFKDCDKHPKFNLPSEKGGIYCKIHIEKGMVDVSNKRCVFENCNKRPTFNVLGEKNAIYCKIHIEKGMIDIRSRRCVYCKDTHVSNKKYDFHCYFCFVHLFPDQKVSRNYKTKENLVAEFITENFKDEDIILDKIVSGPCSSNRRPDIYIDKLTHVLVVEVDEDQHSSTSCESKRICQIFSDFGNRPIIFIRFNPDKYTQNNVKISSCFKINKTSGILMVANQSIWNKRLSLLKVEVDNAIKNLPIKEITVKHLFYNKN